MGELTNKLKAHAKRTYIPMIVAAAICLIAGLALLGSAAATRMNQFKELSELTQDQIETGHYYKLTNCNYIFDYFAEDGDGKYYLVLRPSDNQWMGLYMKGSAMKTAEQIIEDNDKYLREEAEYLSESTVSVKGRLRSMGSEESQFFREYLETSGFSSVEIANQADFRTLDTSETDTGMLIAGIVLTAIGMIWLFWNLKNIAGNGYVQKVEAKIAERGMNPEQVAAALGSANSFNNVDLTPSFAVAHGMAAELIPYDELVWVYKQVHTTVHKLYGLIPLGKTVVYKTMLVDRANQTHAVSCKNEVECDQIIQYISGYAPYLIAGYSEEIAKAAQTDFAQMVQYVDQKRGASV